MEKSLTITINVNSTGITLSIVVSVSLVSVSLEHTVVTAVTNIISICVILGGVVHSWAVVLNSYRNIKSRIKLLKWVFT